MRSWFSLYDWLDRIKLRISTKHQFAGVTISLPPVHGFDSSMALAKVQDAIQVLVKQNPRPRPIVGKYLTHVAVQPVAPFHGQNNLSIGVCWLSGEYILDQATSTQDIASTLVHEAQHSRIAWLGVRYSKERRLRIERLCVMAQLDFAAGLPDSPTLLATTQATLDNLAERWSEANIAAWRLHTLAVVGAPRWLIAIMKRRWRRAA